MTHAKKCIREMFVRRILVMGAQGSCKSFAEPGEEMPGAPMGEEDSGQVLGCEHSSVFCQTLGQRAQNRTTHQESQGPECAALVNPLCWITRKQDSGTGVGG